MNKKISRVKAEEKSTIIQERPWIFMIDVDAEVGNVFKSAGFNCEFGSFGPLISLSPTGRGGETLCKISYELPPNLHEFDIVVVDLKERNTELYEQSQTDFFSGKNPKGYLIRCSFPQSVFDQRPFVGQISSDEFENISKRDSIFVVFATHFETVEYYIVELTRGGYSPLETKRINNYSFLPSYFRNENKSGIKTNVVNESPLSEFLQKYNKAFTYEIVFEHPTSWVNGKSEKNDNFRPLITNEENEIVSFVQFNDTNTLFVFPQLEHKHEFLLELFQKYLPEFAPNLFPFNTQFVWLKNEEYQLPNEANLIAQQASLKKEYERRIEELNIAIEKNNTKHRFLHNLITATGTELVKSLEQYLHWLGFESVKNCDETKPEQKEEDLQIPLDKGLLIIEAKGIGGTSKDSECSQISKIRHRRGRERGTYDVYALYIVNHQRYLPPENRLNPPFTKAQIADAISDERGLLTTYELFKLYFYVEAGLITKEEARNSLLEFGLVAFKPTNSVRIGYPKELHYQNTVGIISTSRKGMNMV